MKAYFLIVNIQFMIIGLSIMYVHIVSAIMLMCCFFSNVSGVVRIIDRKHFKHKLRKEDIDLSTIVRANRNFAKSNKVGEGDFGSVYKMIYMENLYRVCCEKAFK